jgi:hypothetical protein
MDLSNDALKPARAPLTMRSSSGIYFLVAGVVAFVVLSVTGATLRAVRTISHAALRMSAINSAIAMSIPVLRRDGDTGGGAS